MPQPVNTIKDLLALATHNPNLAKRLKSDPVEVAKMFGVELSKEDASKISATLDVEQLAQFAKQADSMVAKVAQGIGLKVPA